MKYFDLCALSNDNEILLLGLTIDSFISYVSSVEKRAPVKRISKGKIIVDRLLKIGDVSNRYVSFSIEDGKIKLDSINLVYPTEQIKQKSLQLLQKNYEYLTYSILTDTQRSNIENNIAF